MAAVALEIPLCTRCLLCRSISCRQTASVWPYISFSRRLHSAARWRKPACVRPSGLESGSLQFSCWQLHARTSRGLSPGTQIRAGVVAFLFLPWPRLLLRDLVDRRLIKPAPYPLTVYLSRRFLNPANAEVARDKHRPKGRRSLVSIVYEWPLLFARREYR